MNTLVIGSIFVLLLTFIGYSIIGWKAWFIPPAFLVGYWSIIRPMVDIEWDWDWGRY